MKKLLFLLFLISTFAVAQQPYAEYKGSRIIGLGTTNSVSNSFVFGGTVDFNGHHGCTVFQSRMAPLSTIRFYADNVSFSNIDAGQGCVINSSSTNGSFLLNTQVGDYVLFNAPSVVGNGIWTFNASTTDVYPSNVVDLSLSQYVNDSYYGQAHIALNDEINCSIFGVANSTTVIGDDNNNGLGHGTEIKIQDSVTVRKITSTAKNGFVFYSGTSSPDTVTIDSIGFKVSKFGLGVAYSTVGGRFAIVADGTANQVLKTNGSNGLSWTTPVNQTITLSGVVTGSGTTAITTTIANGAVTLAMLANMATGSLYYRKTAGTGAPEIQSLATLKTDLLLTGTNSGDVTLAGENYLSRSGQVITANAIDLSGSNVTNVLSVANGGFDKHHVDMIENIPDLDISYGAKNHNFVFGVAFSVQGSGALTNFNINEASEQVSITTDGGAGYLLDGLSGTTTINSPNGTTLTGAITATSLNVNKALVKSDGSGNLANLAFPGDIHQYLNGNNAYTNLDASTDLTNQVPLANGGLNANLTASNGGIFYSTASAGAVLSGTATANKILLSGASAAPVWSTPTFPNASATSMKYIVSDGTNWIASPNLLNLAGNFITSGAFNTTFTALASATHTLPDTVSQLMGAIVKRVTGKTAAATIFVHGVGSADGSFLVSANVLVTTATVNNFTATVTYTDEGNTSRTVTMQFSTLAGAFVTAMTNVQGTVPYEGVPLHIRAKASTNIVISTTGTFTSCVYNVESAITKIN